MTFSDLLSQEYEYIQIPLIQRDYVQGRAKSDRQIEDRGVFVRTLLDALLPDAAPCHLDFIYGSCDRSGAFQSNRAFLPLDGQQRLTTLFLLHWLLLKNTSEDNEEDKRRWTLLKKFAYKTRSSSETFCRKLLENHILIENGDTLANALKYQGWFGNDIKCDPTVQAMLEMIGVFEEALKEEKYHDHLSEMKEYLFQRQCITFNLLDLDEYNLTDGLYVKMNARGKELTEFENWKAEFIGFLSDVDIEWNTSYKNRFQNNIEHKWHDLFWEDVYEEYCTSDRKQYPRIDEHFINYFRNIHRMLFFLMKGTNSKVDDYKNGTKGQQDEVFKLLIDDKPVYLDFLFDVTDWLCEVHKSVGLNNFFASIFQSGGPDKWEDKVQLFEDCNNELNLFKRFASQEKSNFEGYHVLFYGILKYGIKRGITTADTEILEYVRNCRNLLESKSYFDHSALVMQLQVRVTDMADYDAAFENYITQPSSKSSIRRKIEDLPFTHGQTGAFEDMIAKVEAGGLSEDSVWKSILEFNALTTTEKVKVLLSNGFRGVMVGGCGYGKRVFLGSDTSKDIKNKISHWDVVFRAKESRNIKDAVNSMIRMCCSGISCIDQIRKVASPSTPLDYMLKYDDILCAQVPWRGDNCDDSFFFYAMQKPWENLDMISIHSYSKNPLAAAYQVCPMANAVAKKVSCKPHFVGHAAEKAGLRFRDKNNQSIFEMVFKQMEWEVTLGLNLIPQTVLDKYDMCTSKELHATENKDLVEIAVDFINDVFNYLPL